MTLTFLIVTWAMMLAAFVATLIYRGQLIAHENRLCLDLGEGEPTRYHLDHDHATRRIKIVHPICLGTGSLTLVMTLAIAGFWIVQRLT
jgi:hypothetical protein